MAKMKSKNWSRLSVKAILLGGVIALGCMASGAAQAQGVPGGAARGAEDGERAAGPLGAVVGGVSGGVAGGVAGILGADQRPRVREYVVREARPSYRYERELSIGAELPSDGVQYYEVPAEYGVRDYRYTVVNGRSVLVDPRTHRVVEFID
jgi:hypothetical protein